MYKPFLKLLCLVAIFVWPKKMWSQLDYQYDPIGSRTVQMIYNNKPPLSQSTSTQNAPIPYFTSFFIIPETGYYINQYQNPQLVFPEHTFAAPGTYTGILYFSDRYSEPPPPPPSIVVNTINFNIASSAQAIKTPTSMNQVLTNNDLVYIDTNHHLIGGKKNIYAISFKPSSAGKLHFFYGAKVAQNIVRPSLATTFSNTNAYLINQASSPVPAPGAVIPFDGAHNPVTRFHHHFAQVMSYEIQGDLPVEVQQSNNGIESRVFYVFDHADNLIVDQEFAFMAVLTSPTAMPYDLSQPVKEGQDYLANATTNTWQIDQSNIVDFHFIKQKVRLPGDPNSLVLTDDCQCCASDSLKGYLLSYTFEFCNEGDGLAKAATVDFKDVDQVFSCIEAASTKYPINDTGTAWSLDMTSDPLENLRITENKKRSCAQVTFLATTNSVGTALINNSQRINATACTTFLPGTATVCASSVAEPAPEKNCSLGCNCVSCGWRPPWWGVVGVVGIILLVVYYRRGN